ncbi:hypothetical protein [Aquimarina celericrescens]|uniref:Lipoprotein n=1 Tax=Aquimarina celericrescens TaxID=1964542 RepID=A0ABW5ASM5_9FLAO|nr:hypothetical protein [Aquimarina celericrescens]
MRKVFLVITPVLIVGCVSQSKYDEALKEIETLKKDQKEIIIVATEGTNDTIVFRSGKLSYKEVLENTSNQNNTDTTKKRWIKEHKSFYRKLTTLEKLGDVASAVPLAEINPKHIIRKEKPKPSKNLKKDKSNWITKSYEHLKYSYPKNWVEMDYIKAKNNISYGAMSFDLGKTVQFSVIEMPNQTGMADAKNITNDQIKTVIQNLFSPNSHFHKIGSKKIDNINAKYAKASVTGSNDKKLSAINYIIFYDNKMIIIQGIYTTKNEKEYLPILKEIIGGIDVI